VKRIAGLILAVTALANGAPALAQASLTGDRMQGIDVIDRLDAAGLEAGKVHHFWFRASDTALGQSWLVPVIVVRGSEDGPRLLLTAGVHGDELNGIDVIQQLANRIDPARLKGTLTMVPGANTPALNNGTRLFTPRGGTDGDNLNRVMPGENEPTSSLSRAYAYRLWHDLFVRNADRMIDLHTQSRGTAYNLYAFVSSPESREIAEAIAPDTLRLDPGQRGTVENEMVPRGIPAITLELGAPEIFDAAMNARVLDGITRLMERMAMLPAGSAPAATAMPFVANRLNVVRATESGWARLLVGLNDRVNEGQPIATISDAFGRTLVTLTAPVAGQVTTIATDPRTEQGDMLMRIGWWDDDPACAAGCD
jgi:uncharacterized protein